MSQSAAFAANPANSTGSDGPVDLWAELDRLTRDDRARLASRREAVRQSRRARHQLQSLGG